MANYVFEFFRKIVVTLFSTKPSIQKPAKPETQKEYTTAKETLYKADKTDSNLK